MRIEHGPTGYVVYSKLYGGGREGVLVQLDWDYPGLASNLGWSLLRVQLRKGRVVHFRRKPKLGCYHGSTDGTIDCSRCGVTASDFIGAAAEYLDGRAGG